MKRTRVRNRPGRARAENCPPGYNTRSMVCARLGITSLEFRRLVSAQKIVVDRTNEGNYALYSEGQVKVLINRKIDGSLFDFGDPSDRTANLVVRSAEDAIRVFDLIDKGMPLQRIVLEAKLDPRIVDQVALEYDKLSKAMSIPVAIMEQINKLKHLPATFPLKTPTDLLQTLRECEAERICACRQEACASRCVSCIEKAVLERAAETAPPADEAMIRSVISACIIAIESKPQRTWTRDEIVNHLRALLSPRPAAAAGTPKENTRAAITNASASTSANATTSATPSATPNTPDVDTTTTTTATRGPTGATDDAAPAQRGASRSPRSPPPSQ